MKARQRSKRFRIGTVAVVWAAFCMAGLAIGAHAAEREEELRGRYAGMLDQLHTELVARLPQGQPADDVVRPLLAGDALDAKLVKYVVLLEATPQGLAEFAQQGKEQAGLVEKILTDVDLMKQMLVADGPKGGNYGEAMRIYNAIREASSKSAEGVLQRLALAISLEHAEPVKQENPGAQPEAPQTVDPVARYLHYEKAYLDGELDPSFVNLGTWELRLVVDGEEPDWTLAWGREMLRNYRPDHILTGNHGWRYSGIVGSDVEYGSHRVRFDRPELQRYQNILMNGGVCGRRAFFGRFILRAFGIPTIARPSRGHAALARWTPDGWVVNLGPRWGSGWTHGRRPDTVFLHETQARASRHAFLEVKRAHWISAVMRHNDAGDHASWNDVANRTQTRVIQESKAVTLPPLGEELGEANEPTVAQQVASSPATAEDRKIVYERDGSISIPAAAYSKPSGNTQDVVVMRSFGEGLQVFLPRFFPRGQTILRGGGFKFAPSECTSGRRLLSGGFGRYEDWGLRAAMSPAGRETPRELTLDLGDGVTMEMVYIAPGKFIMGGERETDGRFECVEVPKREVTITRGYYLGKYPVTQAQFQVIMGSNPSRSSKDPNAPADNVSVTDAQEFVQKAAAQTGRDVRLPTEAEWEFAARAGTDTKWFFGDDPAKLGEYVWYQGNSGGKTHPVGRKKPNPWGLYDVYGNVAERISDVYARDYYATGATVDPTGPAQPTSSHIEYVVTAPRAGRYALTAKVVTAQYDQRLNVVVNDDQSASALKLPFTTGTWQDSEPIIVNLKQGENTLRMWRDDPPQYGVAVKSFDLRPVR